MKQKKAMPFTLALVRATTIRKHISDHTTIILMLSGQLKLMISDEQYSLQQDDLVVLNPYQGYQIESDEKNLFLMLQLSPAQMSPYFSDQQIPSFDCNSVMENGKDEDFHHIREILGHLMAAYFKQREFSQLEVYQYLFTLLTHLTKKFRKEMMIRFKPLQEVNGHGLHDILTKIQTNYDHRLSLEVIAKESGYSYYYLSRNFKKLVGMTFTEYLNQVRLIHATEELLLTNHSIMNVALNNGFANTKQFHQVFKKYYEITPLAYRKMNRAVTSDVNDADSVSEYEVLDTSSALRELAKYLVGKDIDDENTAYETHLALDVSDLPVKNYHSAKKIIKIGTAQEGLDASVQRELQLLQQELVFDYVQFDGFCEETNFEDDRQIISEYLLNNRWFDFLNEIKLNPMICLDSPSKINSLKEIKEWCDRQLLMFRHFLNRYGIAVLGGWAVQWGVLRKDDEREEYSRWGYRYFYQKMKNMAPSCQIGIMTIDDLDNEKILDYQRGIKEQANQQCLPDFLCFHADPYKTTEIRAKQSLRFKAYQQEILGCLQVTIQEIMMQNPAMDWHPEIYLTEWNTLVGEGHTLSGTFFRSALILESILELSDQIDGIAYWLNIKVKERQTHRREESSLSVFLYGKLRRPLFFALNFLNKLGAQVIAQGIGYVLTKQNGCLQLLVYNSNYLDPLYSIDSYQVQFHSKKLIVSLAGLPDKQYLVRHYTLDKDHGGIYNDWIRVGGQVEIDGELQRYLEQKILPKFDLTKEIIVDDIFQFEIMLTLNACQLYIWQPII